MLRRLILLCFLLICLGTAVLSSSAQTEQRPQPGDPPRVALISLSPPNEAGQVTIAGAQGAVFSNAYLAIRNLYTQETVYTQAGAMGSFSVRLFGPGSTPFLIMPMTDAPPQNPNYPGSLPGGPGTIIYGNTLNVVETERLPRPNSTMPSGAISFTVAAPDWSASGQVNTLDPEAGEALQLELDLSPDNTAQAAPFTARLLLHPVATENGAVAEAYSNNGWSNLLTPSGLAIDNLTGSVVLGDSTFQPDENESDASTGSSRFPLDFDVTLPDDLPAGLYVPVLAVAGDNLPARLPLVLNVGAVEAVSLPLALLMNHPSEGSRGILPQDSGAALSTRVRYNSPTYVLPPGVYPVEPYLPNILPNRYDLSLPPLVPFRFPGGSISIQIIRPNNTRNQFNNVPLVQNQLSTPAEDEAALFGRQSPVDIYRLTSGVPELAAYTFDQYGEYQIQLSAALEDLWGNRYTGGGDYRVLIAEPLDLTPGVLTGTPFQLGDDFHLSLRVAPGVPADVSIRARIFPLDGSSTIEQIFEGQANRYGYYHAEAQGLVFNTPGEYIIDYEARYRSEDGRLWAASFRSAGVISTTGGQHVAHGARGLAGLDDAQPRPAWYNVEQYEDVLEQPLDAIRLNTPFHSGDIVWIGSEAANGIQPVLRLQRLMNSYDAIAAQSELAQEAQARADELPVGLPSGSALVPPEDLSYAYFSATRPDVTVRQMVIGGEEGSLPLAWDSDDLYNGQMGAGFDGDRPGDYIFLFGGVISRPLNEIAPYAALAIITADNRREGVHPPGTDSSPLLVVHDQPVDMFFHPTATRPGDTLVLGDTLSIAGQVAPTLPARVSVVVTSPSGETRTFESAASPIGYFYDPAQDFTVDEIGVWTIRISTSYEGETSAGRLEPPPLQGNVLGAADDGSFHIYVVPENGLPLPWNAQLNDTVFPAAVPYNFGFTIPEGWSDGRIYRTLTTAGYILEDGELRLNGRSIGYTFNPTNQQLNFPNIEVEGRIAGAAASDVKTLTFAITGVDANGEMQIRTRTFTILHDRLVTN